MTNCKSKTIIFVPGCLLCPAFQVAKVNDNYLWRSELLAFLTENNVGIIQMQCPEASFAGYKNGLQRKAHGILYYEKLPGFIEHCDRIAISTVEQICALQNKGYQIKAIMGIENSPTCAVNRIFIYGVGTVRRKGLLIEALSRRLNEQQIIIPYVGISRQKKSQKNIIDYLKELIDAAY